MNKHLLIVGIAILLLTAGLSGCMEKSIVGQWEDEDGDKWTFTSDGKLYLNAEKECYKIADGIIYVYLCNEDPDETNYKYEYSFEGDGILILDCVGYNSTHILVKVK